MDRQKFVQKEEAMLSIEMSKSPRKRKTEISG